MNLQTGSSEKQLNMGQNLALGFQHVFAMFGGATVLVPLLTGLDPSVAFFTSGIGTLLFILLTKNRFPHTSAHRSHLLPPLLCCFLGILGCPMLWVAPLSPALFT